jgi:hypothetical protein
MEMFQMKKGSKMTTFKGHMIDSEDINERLFIC